MIKKFLSILLINLFFLSSVFANDNAVARERLQNKKHFALMNPFVESFAQNAIKRALKKKIGPGKYKVKFEIYTVSSLKKGVFKTLNIEGKNLTIDEVPVPKLVLKSVTDYNWIDYKADPILIKSDMMFNYELELDEGSINQALKHKSYLKTLERVNQRAYPLFEISNVKVRIMRDLAYIVMDYSLPLAKSKKTRKFVVSTDFKVEDGKIRAKNVAIDKAYGSLSLDKVTNLVNLVDPLSFTLLKLNEKDCKGRVENVKIENDIIRINGKIFIKGE